MIAETGDARHAARDLHCPDATSRPLVAVASCKYTVIMARGHPGAGAPAGRTVESNGRHAHRRLRVQRPRPRAEDAHRDVARIDDDDRRRLLQGERRRDVREREMVERRGERQRRRTRRRSTPACTVRRRRRAAIVRTLLRHARSQAARCCRPARRRSRSSASLTVDGKKLTAYDIYGFGFSPRGSVARRQEPSCFPSASSWLSSHR